MVGQPVPLLGRRQQALGQERELLGEDGQLAGLGVAEPAVDADQVAQVEQFDQAPAGVADLLLADEDLDPLGPVAELEEDDLPLPAAEHDPPGDADGRARLARRRAPTVGTGKCADRGDRLVPVESLAPGVEPQGRDPLELLQANGFQALARLFGHRSPYFFSNSHFGQTATQIVLICRVRSTATDWRDPLAFRSAVCHNRLLITLALLARRS